MTLEGISVHVRVCRSRLPNTWKGSCMRQPHAATGYMEWRPYNIG